MRHLFIYFDLFICLFVGRLRAKIRMTRVCALPVENDSLDPSAVFVTSENQNVNYKWKPREPRASFAINNLLRTDIDLHMKSVASIVTLNPKASLNSYIRVKLVMENSKLFPS